ncbi:hypothetical protein TRFO_04449 [Tritrichomonas foetus]|uniref:Uncharacterized protein n=1 Tax=Tritrichomonas foetus TaxID=1144522 RepID=A0A1J4KFE4_9EUKA|nr:hypothetical protein TRFO_04449 [Tritrichomonas foetus]|eukprot:OHT09899.1 hypothetical protein TRFO_04449 [Tritrichomonas foetus]
MLSREEIRHCAEGEGGKFIYDLSKIRHTKFEPLMKGLETFGIHIVHILIFNVELKKNFSQAEELKPLIDYSAASVIPKYFKRLVVCVKRMLENSRILTEVHFNGIKIPKKELATLSTFLSKPTSLEKIKFKNTHLEDDDVSRMFKGFGFGKIPDITMSNCDLTDESMDAIVKYLNKYSSRHGFKKMPNLKLTKNRLSKYAIKQINIACKKDVPSESSSGYYDDDDDSLVNFNMDADTPVQHPDEYVTENNLENSMDYISGYNNTENIDASMLKSVSETQLAEIPLSTASPTTAGSSRNLQVDNSKNTSFQTANDNRSTHNSTNSSPNTSFTINTPDNNIQNHSNSSSIITNNSNKSSLIKNDSSSNTSSKNNYNSKSNTKDTSNSSAAPMNDSLLLGNSRNSSFALFTSNDLNTSNMNYEESSECAVELDPSFVNFFGKTKLKDYGDLPGQVLMTENQKLKVMISRLKGIINEVENNDALFIVGDGVYEVSEFMKAIEKRINDLVV